MECAERFGKTLDVERFKPSQLTEMLALPSAEETEKFIAEKAAAKMFTYTFHFVKRNR